MNLYGKTIYLTLVEVNDAKFILSLRTNERLNKYLSPTENNIDNQKLWISKYKEREKEKKEFYFKTKDYENNDIGVVRLYNIDMNENKATFGSFIMNEKHPKYAALESMILILYFAFFNLNIEKIELDVRINNLHAKNFYQRFGFKKINENNLDEFYELEKKDFLKLYENYEKYVERDDKFESRIC